MRHRGHLEGFLPTALRVNFDLTSTQHHPTGAHYSGVKQNQAEFRRGYPSLSPQMLEGLKSRFDLTLQILFSLRAFFSFRLVAPGTLVELS